MGNGYVNTTASGALRRRGGARRGGQVLVLAIVAMIMLVSLALYVFNVGDQVNRRVTMQNIADSVAVSGGGEMARCMNVVAMNNVAEARAIAIVPVMDAIPLAAEMAYSELRPWRTGMEQTMAQMQGEAALNSAVKRKVLQGMAALHSRLRRQEDTIEPVTEGSMKKLIEEATTWSVRGVGGAPPHGSLWRTAVTLDQFNQATVEAAGLLAQANAVRYAHENFGRNVDASGYIVPILPRLPAHRTELADFSPVLRQHLRVDLEAASMRVGNGSGGAIPDAAWPYRLGPWARYLHYPDRYYVNDERFRRWFNQQDPDYNQYHGRLRRGWRRPWGIRVPVGPRRTGTRQPREGRRISGPSAGGGRAGSGANRGHGASLGGTTSYQPTKLIVRGYTTFGPYEWAKSWITGYAFDRLADSRFREYYDTICATKLNYIFGPINPTLRTMHYPRWITDLAEARKTVDGDGNPIRKVRTRYYYIEVISKSREGSASWEDSITSHNLGDPVAKEFNGWVAPEQLKSRVFGRSSQPVEGPVQVGQLPMWRFTAEGKETILNPDGTVKDEWPVYFSWYFIFGGVDAGGDVEVSNPANWDRFDEPPAPMIMDGSEEDNGRGGDGVMAYYSDDPDIGMRREFFAFLSIARVHSESAAWPQKFSLMNPTGSIYCMAQSKVFNNCSWDLWTQHWQVQLTPVWDWGDWTNRLDLGAADASLTEGFVREQDVTRDLRFMSAFPPAMADMSLNH